MPPFDKMYYHLFNAVTNAERELEKGNIENAMEILKRAQIQTEKIYAEEKEEPVD